MSSYQFLLNVISLPACSKKARQKTPPQSLVARVEQLQRQGIGAQMCYDKATHSYYIRFKIAPGQEIPSWEVK